MRIYARGEAQLKLAIGSDDAGYPLKETIKQHLEKLGYPVTDFGVAAEDATIYPDIAFRVAKSVAGGENERAILICGTGIGMSISANKVKGIRAALAHDTYSAERAQKSNNAQVLCMGSRVVGPELAKSIVDAWLAAHFEDGPSSRKVQRIIDFEQEK